MAALPLVLTLAVAGSATAARTAGLPLGSYRTEISDKDLLNAGAYQYVDQNHGTFTMTIQTGGRWRLVQKAPNYIEAPMITGRYTSSSTRFRFVVESPAELAGEFEQGTWSDDGTKLTFHPVKNGEDADAYAILGSHPWRKVA